MVRRRREDARGGRRKPMWEVLLVPFLIAAASGIITWRVETASNENAASIAKASTESALEIARSQIESAKEIARSRILSAQELAAGQLERDEFAKSASLFQTYYDVDSPAAKRVIVYSLSAYGRTALDFLIRIRKGLVKPDASANMQKVATLRLVVDEAISRILSGAQPDLPGMDFRGKPFRYATLEDFNFRQADFSEANLFQASLQNSNLSGALFENSDLQDTSFKFANFMKAKFPGANLRNSDFTRAKLDGADFTGAKNVGQASFSPRSLAVAKFDPNDIVYLIKKYGTELRADDFHKAILYQLIKDYGIQQSEIDEVALEESYAVKE